jgi:hypothetical protein
MASSFAVHAAAQPDFVSKLPQFINQFEHIDVRTAEVLWGVLRPYDLTELVLEADKAGTLSLDICGCVELMAPSEEQAVTLSRLFVRALRASDQVNVVPVLAGLRGLYQSALPKVEPDADDVNAAIVGAISEGAAAVRPEFPFKKVDLACFLLLHSAFEQTRRGAIQLLEANAAVFKKKYPDWQTLDAAGQPLFDSLEAAANAFARKEQVTREDATSFYSGARALTALGRWNVQFGSRRRGLAPKVLKEVKALTTRRFRLFADFDGEATLYKLADPALRGELVKTSNNPAQIAALASAEESPSFAFVTEVLERIDAATLPFKPVQLSSCVAIALRVMLEHGRVPRVFEKLMWRAGGQLRPDVYRDAFDALMLFTEQFTELDEQGRRGPRKELAPYLASMREMIRYSPRVINSLLWRAADKMFNEAAKKGADAGKKEGGGGGGKEKKGGAGKKEKKSGGQVELQGVDQLLKALKTPGQLPSAVEFWRALTKFVGDGALIDFALSVLSHAPPRERIEVLLAASRHGDGAKQARPHLVEALRQHGAWEIVLEVSRWGPNLRVLAEFADLLETPPWPLEDSHILPLLVVAEAVHPEAPETSVLRRLAAGDEALDSPRAPGPLEPAFFWGKLEPMLPGKVSARVLARAVADLASTEAGAVDLVARLLKGLASCAERTEADFDEAVVVALTAAARFPLSLASYTAFCRLGLAALQRKNPAISDAFDAFLRTFGLLPAGACVACAYSDRLFTFVRAHLPPPETVGKGSSSSKRGRKHRAADAGWTEFVRNASGDSVRESALLKRALVFGGALTIMRVREMVICRKTTPAAAEELGKFVVLSGEVDPMVACEMHDAIETAFGTFQVQSTDAIERFVKSPAEIGALLK